MPREVATILVKQLNVHRVPGIREEDIVGTVTYGEMFTVFERKRGKVPWLRIGKNHWIAQRGASGEVFARVDLVAAAKPPPVIVQDRRDLKGILIAASILLLSFVVAGLTWLFSP